jgi:hypothetical protein
MLYRAGRLTGLTIAAADGEIGSVEDFLFDDTHWTVRWLSVDTGGWLAGRSVLLPPTALGRPDLEARRFPVALTRAQVENSPAADTVQPLSRQYEALLAAHYGAPPYWASPFWLGAMPGGSFLPDELTEPSAAGASDLEGTRHRAELAAAGDKPGAKAVEENAHLRSVREVDGYAIKATDDSVGHVEDFLLEDGSWAIRYIVVDTRNWLPGKKVLVSPRWISEIAWADNSVHVELTRRQIKDSPEWDPDKTVERGYEERLHDYYGMPGYWL